MAISLITCIVLAASIFGSCIASPTGRVRRSTVTYESELGDTISTSTTIRGEGQYLPRRNCKEIYDDLPAADRVTGLYRINPSQTRGEFVVYCDMVLGGGGWTVIQRRVSDDFDFNQTWFSYQSGFGKYSENYWIGLDKIRDLTQHGDMELWIGMESHEESFDPLDKYRHARYGKFLVGDAASDYTLTIDDYDSTDSTIADSFTNHNGKKFTTKDQDNDEHTTSNCAEDHKGGWWYASCHTTNLNGIYYNTKTVPAGQFDGISWNSWFGDSVSMKTVVMAVRPKP